MQLRGWLVSLVATIFLVSSVQANPHCPTEKYDPAIKQAANQYLPKVDWRLFKAQLCAESKLNPNATSSVGAQGIAQIMPATWRDLSNALNLKNKTPYDPKPAIQASAYYMAQMRQAWASPKRLKADQHLLALASYNAGLSNVLAAKEYADNPQTYRSIMQNLHKVTHSNAQQTRDFVHRVLTLYIFLLTGK